MDLSKDMDAEAKAVQLDAAAEAVEEEPTGGDAVLVAVDGSKQSEEAFDWYFHHLHREGNNVILIHALEIPAMPTRDSWEQQMQFGSKKKDEIQEKFEKKLKALGVTGGRFISGIERPGEFIVETAKKENVAYVVMGTRGQGKLRRTIMGSVSDYVVHHIHCPVIVSRT